MMQLSPVDQLIAHLRDKELLLILDNFEHVISASSLVNTLLRGVAKLKNSCNLTGKS
jgi:hypothetical protein